jgi:hypothetical protein
MGKPVSFICKFTNFFSNSQANLPLTFATSTPERSRWSSASGFRDEKPPPRIFVSPVAAAFVGTGWRRFRPDAP